jgi:hypothetical protein
VSYDTGYQGYTAAEASKLSGIEANADVTDAANVEPLVDTHLNTGTATTGEVLSWTGSDYDWIAAGGGGSALELYAENPSSSTAPIATGNNAVALGSGSLASAANCFAAVIGRDSTSSYGAISTGAVAIGEDNKSSSLAAVTVGNDCIASGAYSVALGKNASATAGYAYSFGAFSSASGLGSYAIGTSIGANAQYSVAMGRRAKTTIEGQFAFSGEWISSQGDSQTSIYVLRSDTTDATPEAMVTNGPNTTRGTTNQIILRNNSAYSFSGTIIARQQASAGSDYASWEIKGALLRDGTAATTVLGNGIKNKLYASAGASAWDVSLTADTTNGGLAITVTGAAATNIRWVATVNTSEVTY